MRILLILVLSLLGIRSLSQDTLPSRVSWANTADTLLHNDTLIINGLQGIISNDSVLHLNDQRSLSIKDTLIHNRDTRISSLENQVKTIKTYSFIGLGILLLSILLR